MKVEAKPKSSPAKAKTNIQEFGKAIVEYQAVSTFEVDGKEFKTNLTMYNTTYDDSEISWMKHRTIRFGS